LLWPRCRSFPRRRFFSPSVPVLFRPCQRGPSRVAFPHSWNLPRPAPSPLHASSAPFPFSPLLGLFPPLSPPPNGTGLFSPRKRLSRLPSSESFFPPPPIELRWSFLETSESAFSLNPFKKSPAALGMVIQVPAPRPPGVAPFSLAFLT